MNEIFGLSTTTLMYYLLGIFAVLGVFTLIAALRNRTFFNIAARNLPRRRAQTVLVTIGLMLATLLFSAAFTTGDTFSYSIRAQAVDSLGEVDAEINGVSASSQPGFDTGSVTYFDEAIIDDVREALDPVTQVEGVAPILQLNAPIIGETDLSEPFAPVYGLDESMTFGFDLLETADGDTLSPADLDDDEIIISQALADSLDLKAGMTLDLFAGERPTELTVSAVAQSIRPATSNTAAVMSLSAIQKLTGNEGKISSIIITNEGGVLEGVEQIDEVLETLEPVVEAQETELIVTSNKQDGLQSADELGSVFTTIFLVFGMFSIASGILLIFLIFTMLAAERKQELGIARAVGTQRGHVIRMFTFEGMLYALLASFVGSIAGVLVGALMVRVIASAFGNFTDGGFNIRFNVEPRSLIISFLIGMVFTYLIVIISSLRVSRMNIVRAIRDIPDPKTKRNTVRGWLANIALLLIGAGLTTVGGGSDTFWQFTVGISLLIIAVSLLIWRLGVPGRPAFSLAGIGLIIFWLLPASVYERFFPDMSGGIEGIFISGIMLVIGGVWLVMYNSDLLLNGILAIFGRIKGLPPVLRTAVSYPMANRFRTGMTLAMYSLIIFILVIMSTIVETQSAFFDDTESATGGFDIAISNGFTNPITDFNAELADVDGLDVELVEAVAPIGAVPVLIGQEGTDSEEERVNFSLTAIDESYVNTTNYDMTIFVDDYDTAEDVWQATLSEPNVVIVDPNLVESGGGAFGGGPPVRFNVDGFTQESEVIPDDIFLIVTNPATGEETELRVIGMMDSAGFFTPGQLVVSNETAAALSPMPITPQQFFVKTAADADIDEVSKTLEAGLVEHGVQATDMANLIRTIGQSSRMLNNLLLGFMALGLIVGIAALGVIAARSVVERKQQIGMLRAIGFQKEQVQRAFMIESSFIALTGILLGVVLGIALSLNVVPTLFEDFDGISYTLPWQTILFVVTISYIASLGVTIISARNAAKVIPAEALRVLS